ncbi:MAG TPA: NDP-sugar synthase [Actinomycetota bacterium]
MKAVVLVGGEGTRLRPLTETRPKPLIPFMTRPFLHHLLDLLARHGVEEVVLSSPYLEEEFRAFLKERGGAPRITWITEETPLGTCGAIASAREHLQETFLVCNGDILTDLDLSELVAFHRLRRATGTIALTPVEDARPYGLVETDDEGRILAFREKPSEPIAAHVNAGTYVLEPRALDGVPQGVPVSIERETFPDLIARGEPLYAFPSDAYWRDLGTPESYLAAHLDALEGRVRDVVAERPHLGPGVVVEPGATVEGTVVLGRGARVARGARVSRSVLHEEALVDQRAEVSGSILGQGSEVGAGAVVEDAVLGDGARVAAGAAVRGERVGPDRSVS